MDKVLWEMSWINATMYIAMIPDITGTDNDNLEVDIVKPEDELKFIKLGKIE